MPRKKRLRREEPSHADETRQRALELVGQIRVALGELEPLIADGALGPEKGEQQTDVG